MDLDIPPWVERIRGASPVLLIAPHGGRRPDCSELDATAPRKANDLGTAELTAELARRAGAEAIVNHGQDRNTLDLNRVSHVRRGASWLLDLLLANLREQIDRRGEARVFFIHGWNAIQASCDVGIGVRLEGDRMVPVRGGVPTVPARFLPALLRFAARCGADGIEVTFGDRYPAAARENVLQVFTARYTDDRDPRIRELAALGAEGKVAAVQLELGVPLRWPGAIRDRFVDGVLSLLAAEAGDGAIPAATLPPTSTPGHGSPQRLTLEFHDAANGIGGFAGIERSVGGRRHARLLLCLGRSRLGLFTGEHPTGNGHPLSCAGLRWTESGAHRLELEYDGPFLLFERNDPFLDLESGLAGASLTSLRARLRWTAPELSRPSLGIGRPGRLCGEVQVGDSRLSVDAPSVLGPILLPSPPPSWRERRVVHVPFDEGTAVTVVSHAGAEETAGGEVIRGGAPEPVLSSRVQVRNLADGRTPDAWRIEAVSRSGPLRIFGQVTSAVPVVRPSGDGRVLTFFGLARFRCGERTGHGTFELSRRIETPAPATG
ncbi:MAG: DUF7064 domain-containing protein [Candidatus Binatia bacterium]